MTRPELHVTLTQMLEALEAPHLPDLHGMPVTTEAMLDAAVEVSFGIVDGRMVAQIAPPVSRFESGVMNPVHRLRLRAARTDAPTAEEMP
jgi:hypothetical protein